MTITTEHRRFQDLEFDLLTQNVILKEKQSQIDACYQGGELKTVWMMDSWSAADSLKRMEHKMLDDRDELHQLDQSIVLLYMKILSYQSSKVHTMMRKIENLMKKNAEQTCPADYTVLSYQEWTRTNPKIHALQSEVLDLLGRKIKYRSRAMEDEKMKSFSLKDFTLGTETMTKMRSQTLFFLERDPLVDADFTLHVSGIANVEANTFEAERMRRFIAYCWDNEYSDDLGQTYQEFVGALVEHIMNKFGHMRRSGVSKNDLSRDQIFAIIESHLIPHIYECIPKHHPGDVIMKERYRELHSRAQPDLGIKHCYVDHSLTPYHEAVLKLRELSLVKLPTQKLRTIILSCQAVMKRMSELCTDAEVVAGADEFIDVWVFVTSQAAVSDLCWDILYLKEYSNPNYMLSETGYYLSSLEMAAEYIKSLNVDSTDDGGDTCDERAGFILVPDSRAVRCLCKSKSSPFRLVDENCVLTGYEFVATLDMARDTTRVIRCALSPSSPHDQVTLLRIKILETCNENLLERYLRINTFPDVELKRMETGLIPVLTSSPSSLNEFTFHFHNNGDWSHLLSYSTLLYLGVDCYDFPSKCVRTCDLQQGNSKAAKTLLEQFGYTLHDHKNVDELLKMIVTEIQSNLARLELYSALLPKDGIYSLILAKAVQRFYEQQHDGERFNHQDGVCYPVTFHIIKDLVVKLT